MAYDKKITISKDGQEATVLERSWPVYERNGWTRADDGSSEAVAPQPAEAPAAPEQKTTRKAP